jgi:hypothetical protein
MGCDELVGWAQEGTGVASMHLLLLLQMNRAAAAAAAGCCGGVGVQHWDKQSRADKCGVFEAGGDGGLVWFVCVRAQMCALADGVKVTLQSLREMVYEPGMLSGYELKASARCLCVQLTIAQPMRLKRWRIVGPRICRSFGFIGCTVASS